MAKKAPKQRLEDMNEEHWRIIESMVDAETFNTPNLKDKGIKKTNKRVRHEFRIDGIPYWIILAG